MVNTIKERERVSVLDKERTLRWMLSVMYVHLVCKIETDAGLVVSGYCCVAVDPQDEWGLSIVRKIV